MRKRREHVSYIKESLGSLEVGRERGHALKAVFKLLWSFGLMSRLDFVLLKTRVNLETRWRDR